jgi:hypothetical protein
VTPAVESTANHAKYPNGFQRQDARTRKNAGRAVTWRRRKPLIKTDLPRRVGGRAQAPRFTSYKSSCPVRATQASDSPELKASRDTNFPLQLNSYQITAADFCCKVILHVMNATEKNKTAWFTPKGQAVIRLRLLSSSRSRMGPRLWCRPRRGHPAQACDQRTYQAWAGIAKRQAGRKALCTIGGRLQGQPEAEPHRCLAAVLAREKKAELVTGDPEFKALEKEIKINWLKLIH